MVNRKYWVSTLAAAIVTVTAAQSSERVLRVIDSSGRYNNNDESYAWGSVAHFSASTRNNQSIEAEALADARQQASPHIFHVYTVPEMDRKLADLRQAVGNDVQARSKARDLEIGQLRKDIISEIGKLPSTMLSEEIRTKLEARLVSRFERYLEERERRLRTELTKDIMGQVAQMLGQPAKAPQ